MWLGLSRVPSGLLTAAAHPLLPAWPALLPRAGLRAAGSGGERPLPAAGLACAVGGLQARALRGTWNAWFCQEMFLYLLLRRGVGWLVGFFCYVFLSPLNIFFSFSASMLWPLPTLVVEQKYGLSVWMNGRQSLCS